MTERSVKLDTIIDRFNLTRKNDVPTDKVKVYTKDLGRIGLPLAGYLPNFAYERIQIVGNVEHGYMQTLSDAELRKRMTVMLSLDVPCLIFARALEVPNIVLEVSEHCKVPILSTHRSTTEFISDLLMYVDSLLAKSMTLHGVLLDINGIGTLIMGRSGVGKSEIALELIKRGHRFVADDAVQITKLTDNTLIGRAPVMTKNFLEIRGVGIVDMSKLYGIGSVKEHMHIDLVVRIEPWDDNTDYDRLGNSASTFEIFDQEVPLIVLPVKPGRNLAVILEAAARNQSLKRMGFNALDELDQRLAKMNNPN